MFELSMFDVVARAKAIEAIEDDPEHAHGEADRLAEDVLLAISLNKSVNPQGMAAVAYQAMTKLKKCWCA